MMSAWLGVVSAEHVARGVELGIAQIGHGKRAGLARMKAGDRLVYYSAQQRLGEPARLRSFTALGTIADEVIWQAEEGSFRPFRRRVDYDRHARPVALAQLTMRLELTAAPNWGYQLRRGLVPLTEPDFDVIACALVAAEGP